MKLLKTRIALAVGLLSTGSLALGQTATTDTTMGVSATVADSCNVSATALGFGSYDPLTQTDHDATTTIDVTCSNGTSYDIGLGAGGGGSVTGRQLSDGGTESLNYALYSESGRTTNWGETVGTDTVPGTGTGEPQANTVYGRVPSGQNTVPTGSYTDTINVTVTY